MKSLLIGFSLGVVATLAVSHHTTTAIAQQAPDSEAYETLRHPRGFNTILFNSETGAGTEFRQSRAGLDTGTGADVDFAATLGLTQAGPGLADIRAKWNKRGTTLIVWDTVSGNAARIALSPHSGISNSENVEDFSMGGNAAAPEAPPNEPDKWDMVQNPKSDRAIVWNRRTGHAAAFDPGRPEGPGAKKRGRKRVRPMSDGKGWVAIDAQKATEGTDADSNPGDKDFEVSWDAKGRSVMIWNKKTGKGIEIIPDKKGDIENPKSARPIDLKSPPKGK